jgi:hypothetical protein
MHRATLAANPHIPSADVEPGGLVQVQGLPMHTTAKIIAALVKRCGGEVILSESEIESADGLIVRHV